MCRRPADQLLKSGVFLFFVPGKGQPGRLSCVSAEAMAMELIVEFKKLIESEYQKTHFPTTAGKYALGNRRRKPGTSKENGGAG